MSSHLCNSCANITTILSVVLPQASRTKAKRAEANATHYAKKQRTAPSAAALAKARRVSSDAVRLLKYKRNVALGKYHRLPFPPRPPSRPEQRRIISKVCDSLDPTNFLEDGCAVCGMLTLRTELTPLAKYKGNLSCLEVVGVTRKERFSADDPIEEMEGPVLAHGCTSICVQCEIALQKNKVPMYALANNNWIGEIPEALQDLQYAEKMMIARVRHNRCVIRVNSGRVRMSANAIMFFQPALKVYQKLPPSRDEMSEVLAFVYIGSAAPTQEDFERTPMLVRRDKVAAALEWLKLNHEGYADLEISRENLLSYKDRDIPVVVDFKRRTAEEAGAVPPQTQSVFDSPEEQGTKEGPCSFAVHGLTG
ncbi:hypothetical protein C8R46DRAFT_902279, partial [Mycena filopes]